MSQDMSSLSRALLAGSLVFYLAIADSIPVCAQENVQDNVESGQALSSSNLSRGLGAQGGSPEYNNIMSQLQGQTGSNAMQGGVASAPISSGGGLMDELQSMTAAMAMQNAAGSSNAMTFDDVCGSFLAHVLSGQGTGGQPQSLSDQDIIYLRSMCAQNAQQRIQSAPQQ